MSNGVEERSEKLGILRFALVVSTFAPVFVLWAVRGFKGEMEKYKLWLYALAAFLFIVPNAALIARRWYAKKHEPMSHLTVSKTDDRRDHLIVYLFAMLLPFYVVDLGSVRDLVAHALAITMVFIIFWRLNFHYMNVMFAIFGYRIYSVDVAQQENKTVILISRRTHIAASQELSASRISDTLYWEEK